MDPFEEVAADLQRLREITASASASPANTKEEVRLLRGDLNRKESKILHLQQLISYHQKNENKYQQQLEQQTQLQQRQHNDNAGASADMLAAIKSKWEEVKTHQKNINDNRIQLEQEAANLNARQQNFQQQQQEFQQQQQRFQSGEELNTNEKTLAKRDEASAIRRLRKDLQQIRKEHTASKEELEIVLEISTEQKLKLERATTRISSLKEQNTTLILTLKEYGGTRGGKTIPPPLPPSTLPPPLPPSTLPPPLTSSTVTLLQNMQRAAANNPHDRQFVQEVSEEEFQSNSSVSSLKESRNREQALARDLEASERALLAARSREKALTRDLEVSQRTLLAAESPSSSPASPLSSPLSSSETKQHQHPPSYSRPWQQRQRKKHNAPRKQDDSENNETVVLQLKEKLLHLQSKYENKLVLSTQEYQRQAALALMASENSMREEYRLEVSKYREKERRAKTEMEKLRRSVQLLLHSKLNSKQQSIESEDDESEDHY
tara:strand:- start:125 stop:1603 length:1479 start_codon:yes stop_codon:yes gene_type:complete